MLGRQPKDMHLFLLDAEQRRANERVDVGRRGDALADTDWLAKHAPAELDGEA